uniref:Uncharacterized protein LOC113790820 isoform X1 n=1 Tax=Dermatophagoides pteronyssinus TaxID=6956 RepID=A0A6P6XU12_DERPT|nr:uncharacterized protein LOC113790820 isoform X1 [Dermatophagoides pteronyssinus]
MDDISNSGGSGSGGGGGGQQSQSTTTTISDSYIQSLLALIMDFCCINSNDHQSILSSSLSPSTMLFIFWTIVALIVAVAANIYLKIRKQQNDSLKLNKNEESITIDDDDGEQSDWLQKSVSDHDKFKANHHSKQFDQSPKSNEPFVNRQEWMNEIIKWFYHQSHQDNQFILTITNEWLTSLNNKSQQLIIENGIFVEFVQIEQLTGAQLNQVKMAEELNENLITTMKATCDRLIIQVRVAPDCYGDPNRSAIYHVIMERFSSLPNVERKLLVKIAKANDLQLEKQDTTGAIYCTIELDEPFQSERTSIIREQIDSPEWDQHFIFNLNEKSRELLFELYEEQQQQQKSSTNKQTMKNTDHILGNAIVNIKELISNPSQSQTLRLQSGMNNKQDMGNLIVEFLLMEHSRNGSIRRHDPQQQQQNQVTRSQSMTKPNNIDNHHDESVSSSSHHHNRSSSTSVDHHHHHRQRWSIGSALTTATLTDYCEDNHYGLATITDDGEKFYRNHHHSCQNQINFDDHQSKSSSSFMTTVEIDTIPNIETIISNCNNIKLQQPNFKSNQQFVQEDPNYNSGENGHSISQLSNEPKQITTTTTTGTNEQRQQSARISATLDKRNSDSRPRDKSLLRNIKKRFSFNRRSKSVDRNLGKRAIVNGNDDDDDNFDNDYNNERIGHGMERARSVPGSREPSMPKDNNIHQQEPKIKESFGNLSQASTRTFMHEDSLLIMECNEKGTIKHIIVPTDDMEKARHDLKRRKSTKLHLYKDHLFIARHIPSSRLCQICGKKFAFRLGKQAYQCRDCGLICHKPCHVQVETRCFSSSIASLNLELIDGGYQQQLTLQHNNDNNNTNIMAVPELKITDTEPDDYFIINNNNNNSSIYR